MDVLNVEGTVH